MLRIEGTSGLKALRIMRITRIMKAGNETTVDKLTLAALEVQRLFFEWFFRKDYCFSRDLQSTIQGDYSFYGLWLPGFSWDGKA